jgi:hypothetical protein
MIEHKLIKVHKRGSKYYEPHNLEFHTLQIFFMSTETRCEKIDEKFCWVRPDSPVCKTRQSSFSRQNRNR